MHRSPSLAAAVLAAALAAAGCNTPRPTASYDPFRTPRVQLAATLRVIAIAPMTAPKDLEGAGDAAGLFVSTFDAILREAGLSVIPQREVGPILDPVMESRGGFFDPRTGKIDGEKLRGARKEAFERLEAKFGRVDAIAFTSLVPVVASFGHDFAKWDHTSEWTVTSNWQGLVNTHSGTIRALSYLVRLSGRDGNDLYVDAGGVQLLEKINVGGNRRIVPIAELLKSEQRNRDAVILATDALTEALRPSPSPQAGAPAPPGRQDGPPDQQLAPPRPAVDSR